ncbi:uncharacterized protein MELLADRAFT_91619 [Melampsora larici-populina 98AG31]|uniref:Uncharacterized protein n=1 Tax=Melampsora larici-populina (strain 98AG31 / pathotype 3-4-7) TaxID=747676 RepID=F4RZQ1_MELLP|nr:uncharacterized protein MELLADRAFT_91619 [Melampsora larici-populina 98AG31]EGG02147.1 hypothetical protein MELLADRAFT_91619 [Melampsora larici-populina 98AG31]
MASTSATPAANGLARPSHPVTVSGVIEISALLPPADNRNYTYRSSTVAITCNGWDSDREAEYDSTFTAYCSSIDAPLDGHCYVMKSKFLPDSRSAEYAMYHEADHKILVGTSDTFAGTLNNNTALTGLGVVTTWTTIPDDATGKSTLCFVMQHVDYKPQIREDYQFEIEYRIQPTRNLQSAQGLIQIGRETLINGFIVDWDDDNTRWIVEVTSVSNCTGRSDSAAKKLVPGGQVTPSGRIRPAKHVPSPSPSKPLKSAKSTADVKGKRKAANQDPAPDMEDEFDSDKEEEEELPPPPKATRKSPKKPAKPRAKKAKDHEE